MKPSAAEARTIVQKFQEEYPPAATLARAASLAVRLEPELLRSLRIHLLPGVEAGIESDLWFSPLAKLSNASGVHLHPAVITELREQLRQDEDLLRGSWYVVKRVHQGIPEELRIEEEVTWLALSGGKNAAADIDFVLRPVITALSRQNRRNLARWAARMLPRLPQEARATQSAWTLALLAGARLGQARLPTKEIPPEVLRDWLPLVLPKDLVPARVGYQLASGSVTLQWPAPPQSPYFEAPGTEPVLLEITDLGATTRQPRTLTLDRDQIAKEPMGSAGIEIRTASGDVFSPGRPGVNQKRVASTKVLLVEDNFQEPSWANQTFHLLMSAGFRVDRASGDVRIGFESYKESILKANVLAVVWNAPGGKVADLEEWCRVAMAVDRRIVLLTVPGGPPVPPFMAHLNVIPLTPQKTLTVEETDLLLSTRIPASTYAVARPVSAVPPPIFRRFLGRQRELLQIYESLHKRSGQAVLFGKPGLGTSRLGAEYVHRLGHFYKGVLWIDASGPVPRWNDQIIEQLKDLSTMGRMGNEVLRRPIRSLRRLVEELGPILTVFDGIKDAALLRKEQTFKTEEGTEVVAPALLGTHLLVTTHNPPEGFPNLVRVDPLRDSDIERLMGELPSGEETDLDLTAQLIRSDVQGSPLSARLAASYLRRVGNMESAIKDLEEARERSSPKRGSDFISLVVGLLLDLRTGSDGGILRSVATIGEGPFSVRQVQDLKFHVETKMGDDVRRGLTHLREIGILEEFSGGFYYLHPLIGAALERRFPRRETPKSDSPTQESPRPLPERPPLEASPAVTESPIGVVEYRREQGTGAILFLHGFAADTKESFANFPLLLREEPILGRWDIFGLEYPTKGFRRWLRTSRPTLSLFATEVNKALSDAPLDRYSQLAIIAHGIGGLVAQRAILDSPSTRQRLRNLILISAPVEGVASGILAKIAGLIDSVVVDVTTGSAFLSNLREEWNRQVGEQPEFRVRVFTGSQDRTTPIRSYLSRDPVVIDGDPNTIARPRDSSSPIVRFTVDELGSPLPRGPEAATFLPA